MSLIKFTCAFLHPVLNRRSLGDSTQDVLGPIAESRANSAAGSEIRRRRTSEKTGSHDAGISMVAVGTTIAALSPALIRELPHPSLILESSVNAHDGSGPRNSLLDEHAPQQTLPESSQQFNVAWIVCSTTSPILAGVERRIFQIAKAGNPSFRERSAPGPSPSDRIRLHPSAPGLARSRISRPICQQSPTRSRFNERDRT